MTWQSDTIRNLTDNMTMDELAALLALFAIIAGALIFSFVDRKKRRREFRDRDAQFRHLQDI